MRPKRPGAAALLSAAFGPLGGLYIGPRFMLIWLAIDWLVIANYGFGWAIPLNLLQAWVAAFAAKGYNNQHQGELTCR